MRSSALISAAVRTVSGGASGLTRADMVTKKMRQDHRDEGEELHQSLSSLQPGLLRAAPRLHHLVEDLRLPAQGVPVELLDGPGEVDDRQVCDEHPVDRLPIGGRVEFESMDVGEDLRTIALLFADGWQG